MTPRWKAKEVRKLAKNKQYNYTYSCFHWFETEDNRKFVYAKSGEWNKDTKFYIVKRTNEPNDVDFKYWIYPIPQEQAINNKYREPCINWFGGPRYVIVELNTR
jgi:hypothetical protein